MVFVPSCAQCCKQVLVVLFGGTSFFFIHSEIISGWRILTVVNLVNMRHLQWWMFCPQRMRTLDKPEPNTLKSCCMPFGHVHMVCLCLFELFLNLANFRPQLFEANLLLFKTVVAGDSWGQIAMPVIQENPGTLVIFIGSLVTLVFGVLNVAWQQLVLFAGFCTSVL